MYNNKKHKVDDRIVNIRQPHVWPIIKGKTSTNVEFGAKGSMWVINHYVHVDRISFDAYHKSGYSPAQVEAYKRCTGKYPESVLADKIYRTLENYLICTHLGIHLA